MPARETLNRPCEEDLDAVRATAYRAVELGIRTELLRVSSLRPVRALLEIAAERQIGLLVFGPDRARLPRYRFRRAARTVRKHAPCPGWIAAPSGAALVVGLPPADGSGPAPGGPPPPALAPPQM